MQEERKHQDCQGSGGGPLDEHQACNDVTNDPLNPPLSREIRIQPHRSSGSIPVEQGAVETMMALWRSTRKCDFLFFLEFCGWPNQLGGYV